MEPKKILVVDDDAHLRTLLEVRLGHLGYKPFLAPDGATALGMVGQIQPDLIISDVMMPTIDGFEFCRQLRSRSGFENIPFVFLTALTGIEDRVFGLRLGADDYVVKPFDFRELQVRIEVLLARHGRYEQMALSNQDATTGRLSDLGLADIIQMLAFGRKTCQVDLDREGEEATLYFLDGKMVHAVAGGKTGGNALHHLLTWSDGHFTIRPDVRPPETTIDKEIEEILVEGVRQMDELERLKHALPDLASIPERTSQAPPSDVDPVVLEAIDGRRTIREILAQSPLADLTVLAALVRCYTMGTVTFKNVTAAPTPPAETINLLILGAERDVRNRFINAVLSVGGKGSTGRTQLGDIGEIQLSGNLAVELLGVSNMKHFAPFWLSLAQRSRGFIVLEAGDDDAARFAGRFLKEQTKLPGLILKLVERPLATTIETVAGIQKIECYWENKTQIEKIVRDLATGEPLR